MSPPTDPTPKLSDVDRVRAVALDYIESWYTADAERMKRSLHDDLVSAHPSVGTRLWGLICGQSPRNGWSS